MNKQCRRCGKALEKHARTKWHAISDNKFMPVIEWELCLDCATDVINFVVAGNPELGNIDEKE